jgi:branched-chain amino acid transport system permease protein
VGSPVPKLWITVAVAALMLVLVAPIFLDPYSVTILIRSLLYGSIAVSLDILWGYAGILSFGQAAFFGIGAYAFGLAVTQYDFGTLTVIGAFVAGPAVAAGVAGLVAWLGFGPRVSPLYISVITLVQSVIFVQLIYSGGDFTGSSSGLSGFDTFDLDISTWFRIAGAAHRPRGRAGLCAGSRAGSHRVCRGGGGDRGGRCGTPLR